MSDNPIRHHDNAAELADALTVPAFTTALPSRYLGLLDAGTERSRGEAALIRDHLQNPAMPPLPARVREHRDAPAALTLAACGAYITATLYGGPATGRPHRIIGDLEHAEFGVLASYHNGFGLAEAVTALYAHTVRAGMPTEEFLDALVAETYSDAVYGHGRRSDNPDGYDELRSAELVYAHALAAGYHPQRAARIRNAVLGTGFDEVTKTQAGWVDPDPVVQAVAGVDLATLASPGGVGAAMDLAVEDGMSARYRRDRVIGRALAEHGVRATSVPQVLAFIDAHPDYRPRRDDGSAVPQTVREFFAQRLISNGAFTSAHRYPPTWTGDNLSQRERNARDSVALGEAIRDGEITVVAAYAAAAYRRPDPEDR